VVTEVLVVVLVQLALVVEQAILVEIMHRRKTYQVVAVALVAQEPHLPATPIFLGVPMELSMVP
jgi:hypothetical protein